MVYDLLKETKINDKFSAQGSNVKEISVALQTASKRGTGKVGFPEYVGVVKNFLIVIEDKADVTKHNLLDVWFGKSEATTKFCVETTIESTDEWLPSFYYFNDEIPSKEDFRKTIADYLTFEVNIITHGRGYLFGLSDDKDIGETLEYNLKGAESEGKYES